MGAAVVKSGPVKDTVRQMYDMWCRAQGREDDCTIEWVIHDDKLFDKLLSEVDGCILVNHGTDKIVYFYEKMQTIFYRGNTFGG